MANPYNKDSHLQELAESLASGGVVVSLEVDVWDGILKPCKEWGMARIALLPDSFKLSFNIVRNEATSILESMSIGCSDGFFVSNLNCARWNETYKQQAEKFHSIRSSVVSSVEEIRNVARISVVPLVKKEWIRIHGDENAPPSHLVYSSNLASSLVPSQEDFFSLYRIGYRMNQHSLLFMKDPRSSMFGYSERKLASWKTVDELVAGNARRLSQALNRVSKDIKHKAKRIMETREISRLFINTDMMPSLGLSKSADQLLALVEGKITKDVDDSSLRAKAMEVALEADCFSTVQKILERTK